MDVYVVTIESLDDGDYVSETPLCFYDFDDAVKMMDECVKDAREFEFFNCFTYEKRFVISDYAYFYACSEALPGKFSDAFYNVEVNKIKVE